MDASPSGKESDRGIARLWLVGCCVLAVVAAGLLMPAFASDGIAGSPLERVMPSDIGAEGGSGLGGEGGLGALNPGSATGVGGEVGLDGETFASTDTEVHFTVESPEPAYWRTATYDEYTGSGWRQTGDTAAYDGAIEQPGVDGQRVEYEVTLERTATAVPTVYRPKTVDGADDLVVTDAGAVQAESPIAEGSTIQGVSYLPERDEDLLRAAGDSYPDSIEQRYTQLPSDTPDRLESLTDELVADTDSNYQTAVRIQNWLREQKEYDLGVSRQSDSIADTFVFEMEAGYCEYFATAMTTMLRSQDIPARYVVGYTTGQNVGGDTYQVRGMNAHAWVEVYFPDIGWIRFDPTPGGERLSTYESALSGTGEDVSLEEPGSPGETFESGGIDDGSDLPGTPSEEDGFSTSLNRTAVPGLAVEVTVRYDGDPVEDQTVLFNGEAVGTTSSDGTLVATVPDDDELRIDLVRPEEARGLDTYGPDSGAGDDPDGGAESDETTEAIRPVGGSTVAASAVGEAVVRGQDAGNDSQITGGVHPVERTATIDLTGNVRAGDSVTILVRAGNVRLDGATVAVDGEVVATTTEGRAEVPLPDEPGAVTLTVEYGAVSGERTITVPELELSVETSGPPLPGRTVTVQAELDDEPAAGAVVELDGEEVATTDGNGTATVTLPLSSDPTITVTTAGQTETTTVNGVLRNAGLFGLVGLVVVGGVGYAGYAWRRRLRRLLRALGKGPGAVRSSVLSAVVSLATSGESTTAATPEKQSEGATSDHDESDSVTEATPGRLSQLLGTVRRRLFGGSSAEAGTEPSQVTIREAWDQFLDRLSVRDQSTRTPGELADHAVENEQLPEPAVTTLRDTFREVEYGSRAPADRLDRVQQALAQIERQAGESRTDGGVPEHETAADGRPEQEDADDDTQGESGQSGATDGGARP